MPTVLITGANKGIGLEFSRQYQYRGADVIATCRQASPELAALKVRIVKDVEMTSDEAAVRLAHELSGVRVDVLILNAGVHDSMALGKLDFARMLHEYDVDALGPLRVSQALLPNLGAGAKIVFISSRAGSIGDNGSGGNYGYRMAKAALNMAGMSLARDLVDQQIAVMLLHPGMVDTDLLRGGRPSLGPAMLSGDVVSTEHAVRDMLPRIDELTLATTGRFVHRNGQILPW